MWNNSTANLKLIDNLIVSPDTSTMASWLLTWLQNQEASGQKQRLIVCVLSVTEWLVSIVATPILIRTYKFRTANKSLPPLCIFISQNPWHPAAEPSWRNIGLEYTRLFVFQRKYGDRDIREEYWKWWMLRLGLQFSLSSNITNGPVTAVDTNASFGQCAAYQNAVRSVRCVPKRHSVSTLRTNKPFVHCAAYKHTARVTALNIF
jgi:hypothetical protein